MSNRISTIVFIVLLLHFAVLLYFKFLRFDTLNYPSNDLTMNVESAFSWLNGRPYSYNNVLGRLDHDHNYFILPVMSWMTYKWGVYSVFFLQLVLTAIVMWWVHYWCVRRKVDLITQTLFFAAFLASPTYLWLIDHPGTGWVIEYLIFPATLFFAIGLISQNRLVLWISAILLVSVREEGAILGFYLHTLYWVFQFQKQGITLLQMMRQPKLWQVAVSWFMVFVLGVVYLVSINGGKGSVGGSLTSLTDLIFQGSFYGRVFPLVLKALGLILPTWLLALFVGSFSGASRVVFLTYCVSFLVLGVVQNTRYWNYDDTLFEVVGMTWAPRVFYGYSFVVAAAFLSLVLSNRVQKAPVRWIYLSIFALLWLIEGPATQYLRKVDTDFLQMTKTIWRQQPVDKMDVLVQPADLIKIRKVANAIPDKSDVFVFDYLTSIFHKHHLIWLTGKEYEKGDVAILPKKNFPHFAEKYLEKVMKQPYQKIETNLQGYDVYVIPTYREAVVRALQ